jgi:hypothetical protein
LIPVRKYVSKRDGNTGRGDKIHEIEGREKWRQTEQGEVDDT